MTRILKEFESLINPNALDELKNKLMDEPKRVNGLPDPKDHKIDSDILM